MLKFDFESLWFGEFVLMNDFDHFEIQSLRNEILRVAYVDAPDC